MNSGPFVAGVIRSLPLAMASVADGIVFGYLARQTGLTLGETFAMSALVCSGTAQFLAVQMWSISGFAVLASTLMLNLRYVFLSATLYPDLRALPAWKATGVLFFLYDENWALALGEKRENAKAPFLLGSGLILYLGWVGFSVLGFCLAVRWQPDVSVTGFIVIAIFTALLAGTWRGKGDLLPWMASAAVSLLASQYVSAGWYVLAGGLAGAGCSIAVGSQKLLKESDRA